MNRNTKNALLLLSALCLLISCGDTDSDRKDTAAVADAATEAVNETLAETAIPFNSLPDNLDYQGATVKILGWETYEAVEFTTEEETGDIVNDSVYTRNRNVMERLNVTLEIKEEGGRAGDSAWKNLVSNSNKAGDGAQDIVAGYSRNVGTLALNGELYDLFDFEYLDFTQSWWMSKMTDTATIAGKLFFAAGDISPSTISRTQGIFFNTDIIKEFDLEDPYALTISGTWTSEKLFEMTQGIYRDLNGDGKRDEAGDQFGIVTDNVQMEPIATTTGILTLTLDSDGLPIVNPEMNSDKMVSTLDTWINFFKTSEDYMRISVVDDPSIFRSGRALFWFFPLGSIVTDLRDCEFNIGFVPYPKSDVSQDGYMSCLSNALTLWSIPIGAQAPEMSAAVMEAMAHEGYVHITPALFETAYKVKYNHTGSELQSQVFDIMRDGVVIDLGKLLSDQATSNLYYLFSDSLANQKTTYSSRFASISKSTQKKLDKLVQVIVDME